METRQDVWRVCGVVCMASQMDGLAMRVCSDMVVRQVVASGSDPWGKGERQAASTWRGRRLAGMS